MGPTFHGDRRLRPSPPEIPTFDRADDVILQAEIRCYVDQVKPIREHLERQRRLLKLLGVGASVEPGDWEPNFNSTSVRDNSDSALQDVLNPGLLEEISAEACLRNTRHLCVRDDSGHYLGWHCHFPPECPETTQSPEDGEKTKMDAELIRRIRMQNSLGGRRNAPKESGHTRKR
jgi:hypothetical protein